VPLLVQEDLQEPAPELRRRIGERQESPREQLGSLKLMVRQGMEDARALRRIGHALDVRDRYLREPETGRPTGLLEPHRGTGSAVRQLSRRRSKLDVQVLRLEHGQGKVADFHHAYWGLASFVEPSR
jgi:hypothetical protein